MPSRCITLIHGSPCLPQPFSPVCSENFPVLCCTPALPSHGAVPVAQHLSAWPSAQEALEGRFWGQGLCPGTASHLGAARFLHGLVVPAQGHSSGIADDCRWFTRIWSGCFSPVVWELTTKLLTFFHLAILEHRFLALCWKAPLAFVKEANLMFPG